MTRDEIVKAREALLAEAEGILDRSEGALTEEDAARFGAIETEVEKMDKRLKVFEAAGRGSVESGDGAEAGAPQFKRDADPFEPVSGMETGAQSRGRALKAIERWNADDEIKEGATRVIERAGGGWADPVAAETDARGVAAHVVRFSHPDYVSAFAKYTRDPEGGYIADFTPAEARAWREARLHSRATLQSSGAVLPSPLDPAINLVNTGVAGSLREVARNDTTTALSKRYITSDGATFSFDAELAEVSDDTPTTNEVEITTRKLQGWMETSIEVWEDSSFTNEVAAIIADAKMRAEAAALVNGTEGSNEPNGIDVLLVGTSSEVDPASAETFASGDVYSTIEALPARWRPNAVWVAELSTINAIDQFETTNGAKLFPGLDSVNPTLLRRRLYENSEVDAYSAINTGANGNNLILYVGDFNQYIVLDRIGTQVHFVPPGHIVNSNAGRPDGRVGWYVYARTGADVLDIDAFRVLNVATTA